MPVTSQMQMAAAIGQLERMSTANVITTSEQNRERAAIVNAEAAYEAQAEAYARAAAGMMLPTIPPSGLGVRLASYRSEDQANQAWAALQRQLPSELGSLQSVVTRVALRHRKAVYRLSAGPVTDRKTAIALCREIKRHHQSCQPTILK
jgi:hypothetical protein